MGPFACFLGPHAPCTYGTHVRCHYVQGAPCLSPPQTPPATPRFGGETAYTLRGFLRILVHTARSGLEPPFGFIPNGGLRPPHGAVELEAVWLKLSARGFPCSGVLGAILAQAPRARRSGLRVVDSQPLPTHRKGMHPHTCMYICICVLGTYIYIYVNIYLYVRNIHLYVRARHVSFPLLGLGPHRTEKLEACLAQAFGLCVSMFWGVWAILAQASRTWRCPRWG
jgi:hypothetical protein